MIYVIKHKMSNLVLYSLFGSVINLRMKVFDDVLSSKTF